MNSPTSPPWRALAALFLCLTLVAWSAPALAESGHKSPVHGLALHGEPRLKAGFPHFDYVNPAAPKGGTIRQMDLGTFDSFHGFIEKGVAAEGAGLVHDTLAVKCEDEPFTMYGLVAEAMELAPDRSHIVFRLNPAARFHDGKPMSADDVAFTFEKLVKEGSPLYARYYADVAKVSVLDERSVRFDFKTTQNRELPLIVAELPVLPKHYWKDRDFTRSTLEPPLGSGPYKLADFKPGAQVTYERVKDYWAKNHPVNVGRFNFDKVVYDYYRDELVALTAFLAGEYDFRPENVAKNWATGYTGPAVQSGKIKKEEIPHALSQGMQGFAMNARRPQFADARVRRAMSFAFDFEWSNKNLFNGQYVRSTSYFSNTDLAATGLPSPAELALLEPFRDRLPPDLFTKPYTIPKTDGQGAVRDNLREGMRLIGEAGYTLKDKRWVSPKGEPLRFEILIQSPAFERVALPYVQNLERMGVEAKVRLVDPAQYVNRLREYDFDMTVVTFPMSNSPGNELGNFFGSAAADAPGSRNFCGVKSPVVDALIERVVAAPDRATLVERTKALDRVLLWGEWVVPQWHIPYFRIAYWDKFARPPIQPKYALGLFNWWIDPAKEKALAGQK